MSSEMYELAVRFASLVRSKDWGRLWSGADHLTSDEIQILREVVSAAGFDAKDVVPGKLLGNWRDQDGSATGETYSINGLCPFKVVAEDGSDAYAPTGWLNSLVSMSRRASETDVLMEIERSVPMKPIQLTLEGDMLGEYPPSRHHSWLVDHTRDADKLEGCVGVHQYCRGWMDRSGATATHDVILCRHCHFGVRFPKWINTYGDLRKALADRFPGM